MTQTAKEKFEKQFENLHWTQKARAIGALERMEEESQRHQFIYEDFVKSQDRVLEVTEFANYHFVKFSTRIKGEIKEMYSVYINGKRCVRITDNPHMLPIIALTYEYDGINTQADTLIAKMLGIKEGEDE